MTTYSFNPGSQGTFPNIIISNTSNQIAIGGALKTTLSFATPASARTITFDDPGGNDSIAYLGATQTFTNKTLNACIYSGTVNIYNGSINANGANAFNFINGGTPQKTVTLWNSSITSTTNGLNLQFGKLGTGVSTIYFPATTTDGDNLVSLASTDILSNKTFSNTTIFTAASNQIEIQPNATGNTITFTATNPAASRTITIGDPGGNDSLVYLAATQTLTNKTFTSPIINGLSALTLVAASNQIVIQPGGSGNTITLTATNPAASCTVTIGDPGGNDSIAYLAATQTFTNKTLTSAHFVGGTGTIGTTASPLSGLVSGAASFTLARLYSTGGSGPFSGILTSVKNGIVDASIPANTATYNLVANYTFSAGINVFTYYIISIATGTSAAVCAYYKGTYLARQTSGGVVTLVGPFDVITAVDSAYSPTSFTLNTTSGYFVITNTPVSYATVWSGYTEVITLPG